MTTKRPEEYDLTVKSGGATFFLSSSARQQGQLAVTITVANGQTVIPLKILTIMVRALNEAKNKHDDGSDSPS